VIPFQEGLITCTQAGHYLELEQAAHWVGGLVQEHYCEAFLPSPPTIDTSKGLRHRVMTVNENCRFLLLSACGFRSLGVVVGFWALFGSRAFLISLRQHFFCIRLSIICRGVAVRVGAVEYLLAGRYSGRESPGVV